MQIAAGQLSLLSRPRTTTLHNIGTDGFNGGTATTHAREMKGYSSAVAGAPTAIGDGVGRSGLEHGVTLEPSPYQNWSGPATGGKSWAAATAAAESGVAVDGRRELSLKQLHVRFPQHLWLVCSCTYASEERLAFPQRGCQAVCVCSRHCNLAGVLCLLLLLSSPWFFDRY